MERISISWEKPVPSSGPVMAVDAGKSVTVAGSSEALDISSLPGVDDATTELASVAGPSIKGAKVVLVTRVDHDSLSKECFFPRDLLICPSLRVVLFWLFFSKKIV